MLQTLRNILTSPKKFIDSKATEIEARIERIKIEQKEKYSAQHKAYLQLCEEEVCLDKYDSDNAFVFNKDRYRNV